MVALGGISAMLAVNQVHWEEQMADLRREAVDKLRHGWWIGLLVALGFAVLRYGIGVSEAMGVRRLVFECMLTAAATSTILFIAVPPLQLNRVMATCLVIGVVGSIVSISDALPYALHIRTLRYPIWSIALFGFFSALCLIATGYHKRRDTI